MNQHSTLISTTIPTAPSYHILSFANREKKYGNSGLHNRCLEWIQSPVGEPFATSAKTYFPTIYTLLGLKTLHRNLELAAVLR